MLILLRLIYGYEHFIYKKFKGLFSLSYNKPQLTEYKLS